MVGLFVRLKLRLLRNGLRMGSSYVVGFVLITVLGTGGALVLAVALAASGTSFAVVVYAAMFAGWLLLPVVMSAADETLEPSRLLVFPLRPAQTMRGLFAAAFVGVGPAVSAVVLVGAVIGSADGGPGEVAVACIGAVLQLMLCVAASRALTTTLSAALRSRRGRDLAAGAVVLVGFVPVIANLLLTHYLRRGSQDNIPDRLARVLRWTPPGLAAWAPADAAAGRGGLVVVDLAVVAACAGLAVLVWARALRGISVGHDASSSSTSSAAVTRHGPLARLGDRGRAGAVAARDLRYQWRDPRRRVLWVQVLVLLVFVMGPGARASGGLMVGGVAFVASVLSMQAAQQFGYDGGGYWLHVSATSSRADLRSDLLGKAIAASAITVPLLVFSTLLGGMLAGRGSILAAAVVVELTAFGLGLAASTLLSVWFPVPLPDSSRNVFGGVDPGRGCLAGLAGLGATIAMLVVVIGCSLPLLHFGHRPAAVALAAAMLGTAIVAGIGARAAAARIAFVRLPELLAAVTPRGG